MQNIDDIIEEADGIVFSTNINRRFSLAEGDDLKIIINHVVEQCTAKGKTLMIREGITDYCSSGLRNSFHLLKNCDIDLESIDSFILPMESLLESEIPYLEKLQ